MKEQIQGLIDYATNPNKQHLSDGEMLDILLTQLQKLIK
jgi:hypothetical protein|tara:strand:- start:743 stop:859 length:117 start_codon:yes stop_codon:yes gene_type:complete